MKKKEIKNNTINFRKIIIQNKRRRKTMTYTHKYYF